MTGGPARSVAAAGAALLAPGSDRFAAAVVDGAIGLRAALDLGEGRWVAVVGDDSGRRWTVPLVEQEGAVRRAVPGDGVAEALVARVAGGSRSDGAFRTHRYAGDVVTGERAVTVDQTNESVVVGEAAVVKWSVHLPPWGTAVEHPAVRRLAALAAAGFTGTPQPWGLLTVDLGEAAPLLLATVSAFVPGAVDGWDWAVEDVRLLAGGKIPWDEALQPAASLGRLVATMHAAFAAAGREAATDGDARRWADAALGDLDSAVFALDGPEGERLVTAAPRIATELAQLARFAGTPVVDVHGDLHVGQVLRHGSPPSYVVIDFDGNPVLAPADRARRQPVAVDVAGMMASIDHVGRVVVKRTHGVDRTLVARWMAEAQRTFLDSYREGLAATGDGDLLEERLLQPLRLQQECREFLYAARHLPLWRYVPDQALTALLTAER
jgi:maltokinase